MLASGLLINERKVRLMTLRIFVQTIKKAGKIHGTQNDIALDLCEASGMNIAYDTIVARMKPESSKSSRIPQCKEGKINEAGFIQYFKKRTRSTWPEMQRSFSEIDQNFINGDTEDEDVFYGSLLDLFYDIFRLVPVTLRSSLPVRPMLWGRENEMREIKEMLGKGKSYNPEAGNYAIITGIGGIGKSHVALAYAYGLIEKGKWIVQHVICEDSDTLRKAVNKLQFDNAIESGKDADKDKFDCIVDALKNRKKPVLIILDNLNMPFSFDDRKDFEKLKKCGSHVRFLITSRNALIREKEHIIYVPPLEKDVLFELYAYHRFNDSASHERYINEHKDVLEKMFTLVENHTLMITLLAKLPERIFLNEDEIYGLMSKGLNLPSETVGITKDGVCMEDTVKRILKKIFAVAHLTNDEKSIMRYMSIMPFGGIGHKLFEKLTGYSAQEIRSLINSNLVTRNEETMEIRLHPLICGVVLDFDDTKPTKEICVEFERRMFAIWNSLSQDPSIGDTLSKIQACMSSRVYFPIIRDLHTAESPYINLFDKLKDEYRDAVLELNKFAIKYSDTDFHPKNDNNLEMKPLGEHLNIDLADNTDLPEDAE